MPKKKSATAVVPSTSNLELNGDGIDRFVSQSYDESPEVRMQAAEELSKVTDDPRALLALIELSGDKDPSIADRARMAVSNIHDDGTAMSIEKFFDDEKTSKVEETNEAKEKLMPSIERLFQRVDPLKAEKLRAKLMPSIEKMFSKRSMQLRLSESQQAALTSSQPQATVSSSEMKASRTDGLFSSSTSSGSGGSSDTSYSQASTSASSSGASSQSAIERIMHAAGIGSQQQAQQVQATAATAPLTQRGGLDHALSGIDKMMEIAPTEEEKERITEAFVEIEKKAKEEDAEAGPEAVSEMKTSFVLESKQDLFKKAFEIVSATPGMSEKMIRDEEKRFVDLFKNDIHAAFQMAWLKAKGPGLEKVSNLKMGMKNFSTRELVVVAATDIEYKKGRKTTPMRKFVVADHTGSFPMYLPIVRGRGIMTGDIIKLEKGFVDFYEYTGEVGLSIMPRGKIIVMK